MAEELQAERALGQHPVYGALDDTLRPPFHFVRNLASSEATGISGVVVIALLLELSARQAYLIGVDDDHEVAGVEVWRVHGFVLATQKGRNLRRQASQWLAARVQYVPLAAHVGRLCAKSFHRLSLAPADQERVAVRKLRTAGKVLEAVPP